MSGLITSLGSMICIALVKIFAIMVDVEDRAFNGMLPFMVPFDRHCIN